MEERLARIVEEQVERNRQLREGCMFSDIAKERHEETEYLLKELHKRDERIRKLEKIILDEVVARYDRP